MMKISISLAAILICFFQLALVDANVIDDECPKTPNPDLCFTCLKPYYPPSVRELAIVMDHVILPRDPPIASKNFSCILQASTKFLPRLVNDEDFNIISSSSHMLLSTSSVNANLIDDECPKTPKPNVCLSSMNPYYRTHDPPSVRELAIVMGSTVLVNKVYATINKINELIKEMPSYQVLRKCSFNFQIIRDNKITEFSGSFVKSDYGAAASALSSIVPLADGCSSPLSKGYSDLIDLCTDVSNSATVAAAIVKDIPK